MESLIDFALLEKYAEVKKLNSKLETIKGILDWNAFLKCFPDTMSNKKVGFDLPPVSTWVQTGGMIGQIRHFFTRKKQGLLAL